MIFIIFIFNTATFIILIFIFFFFHILPELLKINIVINSDMTKFKPFNFKTIIKM
jgi:hypothetical protein